MAAHNAAKTVGPSIESLLGQTFADFELIIIDDCSTDDTAPVIHGYADPRIRYVRNERNLGVVRTRNRGFELARGEYGAILDSDDLSFPTRFAKQVAHLDQTPECTMVGTQLRVWEAGQLSASASAPAAVPLAWLLLIENPLPFSSTMFRMASVRTLGAFLLDAYEYAEDFDLQHRLSELGRLDCLPEPLTIYRRHAASTSMLHEERLISATAAVLARSYAKLLPSVPEAAAELMARHVIAGHGFVLRSEQDAVQAFLVRLFDAFIARHAPASSIRRAMARHTAARLWRPVNTGIAKGNLPAWDSYRAFRGFCRALGDESGGAGLPAVLMARANAAAPSGLRSLVRRRRAARARQMVGAGASGTVQLDAVRYQLAPFDTDRPPALYVVVDTEAEFDWSSKLSRNQTDVSAMAEIGRGQAIFDRYGLRPVYVVDYPVASQRAGFGPLLPILDRGACAIGAHLQPWTTPPYEEDVTARNSFARNISPELEARKIETLIATIERNFAIVPRFYKAGRYGIGPRTIETLARHGVQVDFSIVPGLDLSREGGPDFSKFRPVPYLAGEAGILTLPLTRGYTGALHHAGPVLDQALAGTLPNALRMLGWLRRLGMLDRSSLTPEGFSAEEQITLARTMLRRGHRTLVLTFHSPSLAPGHTPYVRNAADRDSFLATLDTVLRVLFEEIGVLPGNPADLLPPSLSDLHPASRAYPARH